MTNKLKFFRGRLVLIGISIPIKLFAHLSLLLAIGLSVFVNTQTADATTITFAISDPGNVIFQFVDGEFLDDDLDFNTGQQNVVTASNGDMIEWTQKYPENMVFNVLSSDKADIDIFRLFLRGDGIVDITGELFLLDQDMKKKESSKFTFSANNLAANVNLVVADDTGPFGVDGDDVLGNQQGMMISGFFVKLNVMNGELGFAGGEFDWEAGDIEKKAPIPEPSTMLLLGSGLAGLGWYRRRRKAA